MGYYVRVGWEVDVRLSGGPVECRVDNSGHGGGLWYGCCIYQVCIMGSLSDNVE